MNKREQIYLTADVYHRESVEVKAEFSELRIEEVKTDTVDKSKRSLYEKPKVGE
jgi:hypothetical protein